MGMIRTKILLVSIAIIAIIIAAVPSSAAKSEIGAWSESVNGIQGRLIITEDPKFNGTRMIAAYLELQNVSDVGTPIEIYFDSTHVIQCQLLDANDKPIAMPGLSADIMTPLPFWLTLPYDSSLRFRISVSGYGVPKDAGTLIQMECGGWLIKATDQGEYALEVTFFSRPSKEDKERRAWKGTLKLPKVRIPR